MIWNGDMLVWILNIHTYIHNTYTLYIHIFLSSKNMCRGFRFTNFSLLWGTNEWMDLRWWKMVRYRNKCSLTEDRWVGQNWNTYCGFHLHFLIDLCQQSCRQNFSFIVKMPPPLLPLIYIYISSFILWRLESAPALILPYKNKQEHYFLGISAPRKWLVIIGIILREQVK